MKLTIDAPPSAQPAVLNQVLVSEPREIFVDPVEMRQALLVVRASMHRLRHRFLLAQPQWHRWRGRDQGLDSGRNRF